MGHPVGDGGGPHQVLEAWNGVKWTLLAVVILDFMLLQGTFWRFLPRPTSVHLRLLIHHWMISASSSHRTMAGVHTKAFTLGMASIGLLVVVVVSSRLV